MKVTILYRWLALVPAVLFCSFLFHPGCGGGGGSSVDISSLTEDQQQAYNDAGDLEETFALRASSGSINGMAASMTTSFPEVTTLINGGADVQTTLIETFSGTGDANDDLQLAIFAYSLEQMSATDGVTTLREYLANNQTSALYYSPHFIAHAIQVLSGDTTINPTYYYRLADLIAVSDVISAGISTAPVEGLKTDFGDRKKCVRQYVIVDSSGDPVTYTDANGATQNAVISGWEWQSASVPDSVSNNYIDRVIDGGGTYVDTDSEFQGLPTAQFNCAGYAFRRFHNQERWTASPADVYDAISRAGLITEVSESNAQAGDMVFYFDQGGTLPKHVAEVYTVAGSGAITVRNADGQSGLFDAAIDAAYYSGNYPTRKIYRWASGQAPSAVEDTSIQYLNSTCDNTSGLSSFFAIPTIPGFNISFNPQVVAATTTGSFSGAVVLSDLPSLVASEGTTAATIYQNALITILFDNRQISDAGTYTANETDEVFEDRNGAVSITYTTPDIVNEDDSSYVVFSSTGGSVTLTEYGDAPGYGLSGTFAVTISGTRTTSASGSSSQTHTGTLVGGFDTEIQ